VGGSISGEHGVGSDKRCYMDWMYGGDDLATMLLVRQALNPDGLANPDKLFPTPRTCAESVRRVQVIQAEGLNLPAEALVF
jgi:glycolate oxidase